MAIRIRKSKELKCDSCRANGGKMYDIGIGPKDTKPHIIRLCDTCMHELLTKLIAIGKEHNGVR